MRRTTRKLYISHDQAHRYQAAKRRTIDKILDIYEGKLARALRCLQRAREFQQANQNGKERMLLELLSSNYLETSAQVKQVLDTVRSLPWRVVLEIMNEDWVGLFGGAVPRNQQTMKGDSIEEMKEEAKELADKYCRRV